MEKKEVIASKKPTKLTLNLVELVARIALVKVSLFSLFIDKGQNVNMTTYLLILLGICTTLEIIIRVIENKKMVKRSYYSIMLYITVIATLLAR